MKKVVALLFGGKSVEHEISIRSAKNVFENIDKAKYDVILVGITKSGDWYFVSEVKQDISSGIPISLRLTASRPALISGNNNQEINIDIVFPVLHGTDGEDGSIQGLVTAMGLPIVGSTVLGSAVAMDKIVSKKLLEHSGIPVAKYLDYTIDDKNISYQKIKQTLGLPFMIKAGNQGSSVGISKVTDEESFKNALKDSFKYSNHILIEEFVKGRELECGILGNQHPKSTFPGEIVLKKNYDFYTYEAKYLDEEAIEIVVPANISKDLQIRIRELSEKAFLVLRCNDYARVDVFVTSKNEVLINEINTIPGFTNVSMFPMLWSSMGINYSSLIDGIIQLALERWLVNKNLQTDYKKN